jgi:hypothetical protein
MRNCLIAIVVWIALFAGYAFWLSRSDLPVEGALLGGAMMSFLVGLGLAMISSARFAIRDHLALERFRRGERPRDGELAAVTGEIRPAFESLRAPFSGRECVVYRYDIGPDRANREVARDYAGFAFARCAIHSPYGTYALGVFPVLHGFPEQRASSGQAYVEATEFEELSNVLALAKYTLDLHHQPPPFRMDWQFGRPSEGPQEAKEAVVASGATVTAYGRYSASANALVSGEKGHGYLRLYPGNAATLAPNVIPQFVTGIVLIVVANVGMLIVVGNMSGL